MLETTEDSVFEEKAEEGMAIPRSMAEKEVSNWLEYKKVRAKDRKQKKDSIEKLVDAFEDGTLSLSDDFVIRHSLICPIESEESTSFIKYKPRVNTKTLNTRRKAYDIEDVHGQMLGTVCVLTGEHSSIIGELDSSTDYPIARAIAGFFI